MAFLSVTSCALACSTSASWAIKARRRTIARYSINRRFTLSSPKWSASSCDFALERKSVRVTASEPAGGGAHGNAVSHSSWQQGRRFKRSRSGKTRSGGTTHVVPHDAVFRVLRRNSFEAASLGRGHAAHFGACGESVDSAGERLELVLVLNHMPSTVQIGVAELEPLQLGINYGELLAQEERLLLLRKRFVNGRSDLRADFIYG